jgi:Uma2 family endonuclease
VDGLVVERNLGEYDHAELQGAVFAYFYNRRKEWGIHVLPELRVRVSATRFRIPDVCVVVGERPREPVLTKPPFICVEILSSENRLSRMQRRNGDFLTMGVPYVFILDPPMRKAYRCTSAGLTEVTELRTEAPEMVVPVEALFE